MMFEDTSTMEEFSTKQGLLFYSFPMHREENGLPASVDAYYQFLPHAQGREGENQRIPVIIGSFRVGAKSITYIQYQDIQPY